MSIVIGRAEKTRSVDDDDDDDDGMQSEAGRRKGGRAEHGRWAGRPTTVAVWRRPLLHLHRDQSRSETVPPASVARSLACIFKPPAAWIRRRFSD